MASLPSIPHHLDPRNSQQVTELITGALDQLCNPLLKDHSQRPAIRDLLNLGLVCKAFRVPCLRRTWQFHRYCWGSLEEARAHFSEREDVLFYVQHLHFTMNRSKKSPDYISLREFSLFVMHCPKLKCLSIEGILWSAGQTYVHPDFSPMELKHLKIINVGIEHAMAPMELWAIFNMFVHVDSLCLATADYPTHPPRGYVHVPLSAMFNHWLSSWSVADFEVHLCELLGSLRRVPPFCLVPIPNTVATLRIRGIIDTDWTFIAGVFTRNSLHLERVLLEFRNTKPRGEDEDAGEYYVAMLQYQRLQTFAGPHFPGNYSRLHTLQINLPPATYPPADGEFDPNECLQSDWDRFLLHLTPTLPSEVQHVLLRFDTGLLAVKDMVLCASAIRWELWARQLTTLPSLSHVDVLWVTRHPNKTQSILSDFEVTFMKGLQGMASIGLMNGEHHFFLS